MLYHPIKNEKSINKIKSLIFVYAYSQLIFTKNDNAIKSNNIMKELN